MTLRRGDGVVPRAASVIQETVATSKRLAEEHLCFLEGGGGVARNLMPGARGWRLVLRGNSGSDERLCGREGWFGTMAHELGLLPPPPTTTAVDTLLQPAQSKSERKQYGARIRRELAGATAALQEAMVAATPHANEVGTRLVKYAAQLVDQPHEAELQLRKAVEDMDSTVMACLKYIPVSKSLGLWQAVSIALVLNPNKQKRNIQMLKNLAVRTPLF